MTQNRNGEDVAMARMTMIKRLALAAILALLLLLFAPLPFVLASALMTAAFWREARGASSSLQKAVLFNIGFAGALFFVVESYFAYHAMRNEAREASERMEGEITHGYQQSDPILGYRPARAGQFTAIKRIEGEAIYDVIYTIDEHLRRITPHVESSRCVVFFGGSVTFGEGVEDHESLPFRVGELAKLRVLNFGFHGYGTHQMLAAIENDLIDCVPDTVIYQAIPGHVGRILGSSWDHQGPRYRLEQGQLVHTGSFADHASPSAGVADPPLIDLRSPYLLRWALGRVYRQHAENHVQLFQAIVRRSRELLDARFAGVQFHMLLWNDNGRADHVVDGLTDSLDGVHRISRIIPDLESDRDRYLISGDGHPRALAYALIADYVVERILRDAAEAGDDRQ